jgi:general nucleoside transport system permease protein
MNFDVLTELLAASIRIATPLLLVALGGVISELGGTFAVGVEGMMLMGAFGGAVTALVTKSLVLGLLASCICAVLLAAVIAVATVKFRADHMVTGLANQFSIARIIRWQSASDGSSYYRCDSYSLVIRTAAGRSHSFR